MNLIKCKFRTAVEVVSYPQSVFSLFGDDLEFAFLCADFGRRTFLLPEDRMSNIYIVANSMREDFIIHAATTNEELAQAVHTKLKKKFSGTEYCDDLEILKFSDADAIEFLKKE